MSGMKKSPRVSQAKRYAQIEEISLFGNIERMGPIGLYLYAEAFLTAARSLPAPTVPFEPVRPYLVCHSIELALKAYLSVQGATMLELANDRSAHNLEGLLQRADKKQLGDLILLSKEQCAAIQHISSYYNGKVFEYPAVGEAMRGYPNMPAIEILIQAAITLVEGLRQPCMDAK